MKILLMGDASNYHRCLAGGLADAGHDVTVASHGSRWMNTGRDIDLYRHPGRLGGLWLWTRLNTTLARRLRGYDVVCLAGTYFVDQRPERIKAVFDSLRRRNGSVYLSALGTDTAYVDYCLDPASRLRYNEWREGSRPTPYALANPEKLKAWRGDELRDLCFHIYNNVDGVLTALYEYDLSARNALPGGNVAYAGIPVDTAAVEFAPLDIEGPIRVLQGCHEGRELEKGADRLRAVMERVARDYPDKVAYEYVANLPYDRFIEKMRSAHIIVDQLYSYTPATTALLAMAMGKAVVSGGEEDYYRFIGESTLRPVINAVPGEETRLYDDIVALVNDPARLAALGKEGRRLVERHNEKAVVAHRFISLWD